MSNSLASIMYTDVVGYSKLTGDNQEIALIILEEHNKILNKFTKIYKGKIVKLTGDGLCALFDSPLGAIKCAIDIQKALDKRNKLNIKERKIQIRIGLHYGSFVERDDDVFGDGVNLAKMIEPIAPHGGIAISSTINDMIWDESDIYTREYLLIDFGKDKVQTYEVYLDLIDWFENNKNKNTQNVNSDKMYKKAHQLFHKGDYSSALKFATLSLQGINESKKNEILSFICHTFISIGEFEYAQKIILQLEDYSTLHSSDLLDEDIAHLYKMKGNLAFNLNDFENSLSFFEKSLNLMKSSKDEYVNEIIYNISIILDLQSRQDLIKKYLQLKSDIENEYNILIEGILLINGNRENNEIKAFEKMVSGIKNNHLKALAYRIVAIIYFNMNDYNESQKNISKAQKFLSISLDNISDVNQREKFIDNIYIHKDIMTFSDKISDYHLKMTIQEIKSEDNISKLEQESNTFHKFCTNCGNKNSNNYKFCTNCGNNLTI